MRKFVSRAKFGLLVVSPLALIVAMAASAAGAPTDNINVTGALGITSFLYYISMGFRHVFVQPGWRLQPYTSGGAGLGWIDSTDAFRHGQGQDFTFNILSAAGFDYLVNDHLKINVGVLYQHLSNAGQTDPNPSLNLLGPQVGLTFSF